MVQILGSVLPQPLNLDGHSMKTPKAKPKVQTHTNLMIEILLDLDFNEKTPTTS